MTKSTENASEDREPTPPRVNWLDRARRKIRQGELIADWDRELQVVFDGQGFGEITVHDVFLGYNQDERRRVVLAVQVSSGNDRDHSSESVPPQSHIVKLGLRSEVERDFVGWKKTLVMQGVVSRLLSGVRGIELPNVERFAVVYQDAFRLYGVNSDDEVPRTLHAAIERALATNDPESTSIERLLVELFSDMFRCCYRQAREGSSDAARFILGELNKPSRLPDKQSAWDRWNNDSTLLDLRRDALWLTTSSREPDSIDLPLYLDPVDYFRAVLFANSDAQAGESGDLQEGPIGNLSCDRVPQTLIGPGHGDLHGLNVVVGVVRGEVFQPAVFDYGDMSPNNLPVWDFVKLEIELKCRLVPELCESTEAREALRRFVNPKFRTAYEKQRGDGPRSHITAEERKAVTQVGRLEAAFLFEQALASLTAQIDGKARAEKRIASQERSPTGHSQVDRALCLFLSLRKEAACWLGFELGRVNLWRDEYSFALAAYGLLTAKWNVEPPHQAWALMSAGVAIAQLEAVTNPKTGLVARLKNPETQPTSDPSESHLIPLAIGARLNRKDVGNYAEAAKVLRQALADFPNAVSLRAELALALAWLNDRPAALEHIQTLRPLCRVFCDHETQCRLGRIYKDLGDEAWKFGTPSLADFIRQAHPGYQLYGQALEIYREAFEFSGHYYPGINAATLAKLRGEPDADQLAEEVLQICRHQRPAGEERLWIFATEGEAGLLLGRADAMTFYQSVFCSPFCQKESARKSIYHQLCRLHWALGAERVGPIIQLMQDRGLLTGLEPLPCYKK